MTSNKCCWELWIRAAHRSEGILVRSSWRNVFSLAVLSGCRVKVWALTGPLSEAENHDAPTTMLFFFFKCHRSCSVFFQYYFGEQRFPPWCPAYVWLMNRDINESQWFLQAFSSYSGSLLHWGFCVWSNLGQTPTSTENSHTTKLSSRLAERGLMNIETAS